MELTAILANHADAQNNLLFVSGGGITQTVVPAGSEPPYAVVLGLGLLITVPWSETDQQHRLEVALVDIDGRPVMPDSGEQGTLVQSTLTVGRGPGLVDGDPQTVAFAVNMPGMPIPRAGEFTFVMSIDGTELARLPYRLRVERPQSTGQSWGPASIPGL